MFKPGLEVSFGLGSQCPCELYKQQAMLHNMGGMYLKQKMAKDSGRIEIKGKHDSVSKVHFSILEHCCWFY